MPDTNGQGGTPGSASGTQAQAAQQGQGGQGQQQQGRDAQGTGGTPAGQQQGQGQGDDYRELRGALDRERERAAELERERNSLRDERLPAAERDQRELAQLRTARTEWETERRTLRTQLEATRHASRLGFADPEDAYRLLDMSSVQFDREGRPLEVERQLNTLLESKPYLRSSQAAQRQAAAGGDAGQGARGGTAAFDMNDMIRRAAGRA